VALFFGIDLGTTNSLIAHVDSRGATGSYPDTAGRPHPSAVRYDGGHAVVGREVKDALVSYDAGAHGDVIVSPKRHLQDEQVFVAGRMLNPSEVVAEVFRHLRDNTPPNVDVTRAVVTIPVAMQGEARKRLRDAAAMAGIEISYLVHEPLAALYGYIRQQGNWPEVSSNTLSPFMLVVDWGGGTLDITLCRVVAGSLVQIETHGDNEIGGDRFDEALKNLVIDRHIARHGVVEAAPGAEARLLARCELAKIALSTEGVTNVVVPGYGLSDGSGRDLNVEITRADLEAAVLVYVQRGMQHVVDVLARADVPSAGVDTCLAIGGVVEMPAVSRRLIEMFNAVRVKKPAKPWEAIALGAAYIAADGVTPVLAKNVEIAHAGETFLCVVPRGTPMPGAGLVSDLSPVSLYCVDPRDGRANVQLMRPGRVGPVPPSAVRHPYGAFEIPVDADALPYFERLEVRFSFDDNMILRVHGRSLSTGQEASTVIHDLEFGLRLPGGADDSEESPSEASPSHGDGTAFDDPGTKTGAIRVRANVAARSGDTLDPALVPGELFLRVFGGESATNQMTDKQRDEYAYYQPCAVCGRAAHEIRNCENATCASGANWR
jgi:molecular chaperone DnaK